MRVHRVLLIVNPVARTYSKPVMAVIEKALSADFRLEVAETKGRGHARELAAQAASEGVHMVAVLSGDGTINETVNALAGTETALAPLPGGATNILVRALGLPLDPVEATGVLISKALDDEAFTLSLGRADGRYFAVNCGAGVDAAAMKRLDAKFPKTKAKFDRVAFRVVAWQLLVGYAGRRPDLRLSVDGEPQVRAASGVADQQLPGDHTERDPVELRLGLRELRVEPLHRGRIDAGTAVDREVATVRPAEAQRERLVIEGLGDQDAGRLDGVEGQAQRPHQDVGGAARERGERRLRPREGVHGLVDRPVPRQHGHHVDTLRGSLGGQLTRVPASLGLRDLQPEVGGQGLLDHGEHRPGVGAGHGIDDEEDPVEAHESCSMPQFG